jgi:hypothetical protein
MEEAASMAKVKREPVASRRPVVDPADWKGRDLATNSRWSFHLDSSDIDDLLSAAANIRRRVGNDPNGLLQLSAEAFNFGAFEEKIRAVRHELKDGFGVALVRGLPLDEMELIDAATIYWGIGLRLGVPCSNNPEGDMLGHVTDLGKSYKDPNSRGYQTREEMAYHCDQSTIVGLLCVRTAREGGQSKIASSIAMYNEMLRRSPESVEVLTRPLCWTKHGEMNPGDIGYYESPVFNFIDQMLCTAFGPAHIRKGHALPEAPDMTEEQRDAIELAKKISEEQHYGMEMHKGDMQFLNNLVTVHTRTEYTDWPDSSRKRLLWRLWLINPEIRPSTPYIKQWSAGVKVSSTVERVVL